MLAEPKRKTNQDPPVVRGFTQNGNPLYVGRDLAKVMGFSDVSDALDACDPRSKGAKFVRGGLMSNEGFIVVINEKGKNAMLKWAEKNGKIPNGVTFDLSLPVHGPGM